MHLSFFHNSVKFGYTTHFSIYKTVNIILHTKKNRKIAKGVVLKICLILSFKNS